MSDELTRIERASIRAFVQRAADEGYLSGRVLDYGCGRQPYRDIVEAAGGTYVPFDMEAWPANVSGESVGSWNDVWYPNDVLLSNQVVQYVPEFDQCYLQWWRRECIVEGGHLVLTYPTNWPEVEPEDLHRFTKAGMERLLTESGFEVVRHERRADFTQYGYEWAFGYGVVARA